MTPGSTSGRDRLRAALLRFAPGARLGPPRVLGAAGDAGDAGEASKASGAPARGGLPHPRILVIRPDHLGDVVLAGPALARLRALRPDADVTLLVGPWSQAVAELLPGADRVITAPFPAFARGPKLGIAARYSPLLTTARRLRAARFDAALVLRDDDWWSAWLTALAGIPVRIGHYHPASRPFLTDVLSPDLAARHVTAASLALVDAALDAPRPPEGPARDPLALRLSDAHRQAATALLGPATTARPPIAIHPGSGSPIKRWHADDWGEVARELTEPGEAIVLTGGPDERALTAAVAHHLGRPILDLAGRTDVATLAAVFAACRLVLGPDSGPLHLAVAAGTPTVHLYGPADARRFGPWGAPERHAVVASDLPCAPCGRLDWPSPEDHPCVRLLAPGAVVVAARRIGSGCGGAPPTL